MDFSKFKTPDWLMVGGGLGALIFGLFLHWASVSGNGTTVTGNNAFDYFFTGGIACVLAVAVGVVAFLLASGRLEARSRPWPLILFGASALALVLMVLRLIIGAGSEQGVDLDRAVGMYLTFVAVAVVAIGAYLNFQASGGSMSDLTDVDKMRGSFKRDTPDRP